MNVREYNEDDDSIGDDLFEAGLDDKSIQMWEHAERMMLLGEGLEDALSKLQVKHRHKVPPDVWQMVLNAAFEGGKFQAAQMVMRGVVRGDVEPTEANVVATVEMAVSAARSFYSWRATAIEAWTAHVWTHI